MLYQIKKENDDIFRRMGIDAYEIVSKLNSQEIINFRFKEVIDKII